MSFTEKHKDILLVIGGFLLVLFLVWLFYLRGNAARTATADKQYEKEITKEISIYANPDATAKVSNLTSAFQDANRELETRYQDLSRRTLWKFPTPLIPPDAMPQVYVRVRLRDERDYAARQLSTVKNIRLSAAAQLLGMDLPTDVSKEELKVEEAWMRQITVLRRFIDVILALPEEKPGEQSILSIDLLRPLLPVSTGSAPAFLREHPVEISMRITMGGLVRLLAALSRDETMHTIRFLEITSDPEERRSRFVRHRDEAKKEETSWFTHYYSVHLVAASVEALSDEEKAKQKKPAAATPRARTPMLH